MAVAKESTVSDLDMDWTGVLWLGCCCSFWGEECRLEGREDTEGPWTVEVGLAGGLTVVSLSATSDSVDLSILLSRLLGSSGSAVAAAAEAVAKY